MDMSSALQATVDLLTKTEQKALDHFRSINPDSGHKYSEAMWRHKDAATALRVVRAHLASLPQAEEVVLNSSSGQKLKDSPQFDTSENLARLKHCPSEADVTDNQADREKIENLRLRRHEFSADLIYHRCRVLTLQNYIKAIDDRLAEIDPQIESLNGRPM